MNLKVIFLFCVFLISALILYLATPGKIKADSVSNTILPSKELIKPVPLEMYGYLEKYSEQYKIPRHIAYNIAYLETRYKGPFDWGYNPSQTSYAGAIGAMQIMPSTANFVNKKTISKSNLKNDIELNIKTSMKYLSKLYERYDNWFIACGYYNTGKPVINNYSKYCVNNMDYRKNWIFYK